MIYGGRTGAPDCSLSLSRALFYCVKQRERRVGKWRSSADHKTRREKWTAALEMMEGTRKGSQSFTAICAIFLSFLSGTSKAKLPTWDNLLEPIQACDLYQIIAHQRDIFTLVFISIHVFFSLPLCFRLTPKSPYFLDPCHVMLLQPARVLSLIQVLAWRTSPRRCARFYFYPTLSSPPQRLEKLGGPC